MNALITGVNSVANKVLMSKLIDLGYDVVAHYHRDNDLTEELKKQFPKVTFLQADFTDEKSVAALLATIKQQEPYDVLVNGAVIYKEADGDWQTIQTTQQNWQETFAVNTAVPGMLIAQADTLIKKGGVIVNISSAMGQKQFGDLTFTMYSASKAALDLLTANYAKRWAPNIRVVGIAPAYVHSAWNMDMNEEDLKPLLKDHLTERLIEPEEIADLMALLIKNEGMNATTVLIDGGYSAPIIAG